MTGLDRVVLGRQAKGVVAHWMEHALPITAFEVRDRVAHRIDLQVADVRLAARVGQHLEYVLVLCLCRLTRNRVGYLPGPLLFPQLLPARLYLLWVVLVLAHRY